MTDIERPLASAIVLVVEDDPLQRLDMIDMVEEAGFEAVEAWSADHAVAILEKRTDVGVVFTDVDMPGSMDGLRLATLIRHRWPPIEIVVTSAGRKPNTADLPARTIFLPKPIDASRAVGAMRMLFEEARHGAR